MFISIHKLTYFYDFTDITDNHVILANKSFDKLGRWGSLKQNVLTYLPDEKRLKPIFAYPE